MGNNGGYILARILFYIKIKVFFAKISSSFTKECKLKKIIY